MSIWPVNFDNYKIERRAKSEENKNIDKDKNLEIEALKELNSLIGLNKVKQIINELYALEQVQIKRKTQVWQPIQSYYIWFSRGILVLERQLLLEYLVSF